MSRITRIIILEETELDALGNNCIATRECIQNCISFVVLTGEMDGVFHPSRLDIDLLLSRASLTNS